MRGRAGLAVLPALLLSGVCSLRRRSGTPDQTKDSIADGHLEAHGPRPPANGPTPFVARMADDPGRESRIVEHVPVRQAVESREFDQVVQPLPQACCDRNSFSVLPHVGAGHAFGRDSIVRGMIGIRHPPATSHEQVMPSFLGPIEVVQIITRHDGSRSRVSR